MTKSKKRVALYIALSFTLLVGLVMKYSSFTTSGFVNQYSFLHSPTKNDQHQYLDLAKAAEERTLFDITYDGRYEQISYPMGDVDPKIGVCTDVVIRSYRKLGIDLQVLVHDDMKDNFLSYPKRWRLLKPDTNIDHRRVPNLMTFFNRQKSSLPITGKASDYRPGDIVCWDLGGGFTHIGIVSSKTTNDKTPLIVHNIGLGPKLDDILFKYKVIGHYSFRPKISKRE
ncbi:MAG: DUF1287 domain-containing protein [Lentisphaeraceae bacterium]|nr:DUF1287 domain-containing protein [Lentisphaeraceae bacterium]